MDSTFYVFATALALGIMFYAHMARAQIYHIFSAGVFLFLGITLSEHTPLLVVFIGLVILELYNTFRTDGR
jgi:phosphotransferase system  glucose/maltose/N-acetylglucosamine-specific IIC component